MTPQPPHPIPPRRGGRSRLVSALVLLVPGVIACGDEARESSAGGGDSARGASRATTLVVYNAGSLARPMGAALDRFAVCRV